MFKKITPLLGHLPKQIPRGGENSKLGTRNTCTSVCGFLYNQLRPKVCWQSAVLEDRELCEKRDDQRRILKNPE